LSSSRSNELMKIIYQQLNQRQAAKKQGLMVVAKKLLLIIYALWKNSTEYDPQKNIESRLLWPRYDIQSKPQAPGVFLIG